MKASFVSRLYRISNVRNTCVVGKLVIDATPVSPTMACRWSAEWTQLISHLWAIIQIIAKSFAKEFTFDLILASIFSKISRPLVLAFSHLTLSPKIGVILNGMSFITNSFAIKSVICLMNGRYLSLDDWFEWLSPLGFTIEHWQRDLRWPSLTWGTTSMDLPSLSSVWALQNTVDKIDSTNTKIWQKIEENG